jgi:hypothetical protein
MLKALKLPPTERLTIEEHAKAVELLQEKRDEMFTEINSLFTNLVREALSKVVLPWEVMPTYLPEEDEWGRKRVIPGALTSDERDKIEGYIKKYQEGKCTLRSIPGYDQWYAMNHRCYNPNNKDYCLWGGRGVEVYPEWRRREGNAWEMEDPTPFFAWLRYMGPPQKDLQNDRINPHGWYWPGNVQWASTREGKRRPDPRIPLVKRALRDGHPIRLVAECFGLTPRSVRAIGVGSSHEDVPAYDGADFELPSPPPREPLVPMKRRA